MKLLRFEFKKMLKQKKYLWIFVIITLLTTALFMANSFQRSRAQGRWAMFRILDSHQKLTDEWERREVELIKLRDQGKLDQVGEEKLQYSRAIARSLANMRISYRFDFFDRVPGFEQQFLESLQKFTDLGGEFSALEGMDREIAIERNEWLRRHELPFEFEGSPVTPHLFLKDSSSILLGLIGIILLLLFFGNSLTEEKENSTWKTLNTQPICKAKLIFSKYIVFLFMAAIFVAMFLGVGILIPFFNGHRTLSLSFPQVLTEGERYIIISTGEYILRSIVLFLCVASIGYSMIVLISKWFEKTLSGYICAGIGLSFGNYLLRGIETPFNPFYLIRFGEILRKLPSSTDWLYILSALLWTTFFMALLILLPEKEIKVLKTLEKKLEQWISNEKPFAKGKTTGWAPLLWKIRLFEWRKVKRDSLLRIFSISMVVLIISGYYLVTYVTDNHKYNYLQELDWRISAFENRIRENQENIKELMENVERLEEIDPNDFEGDGYVSGPDHHDYLLRYYKDYINGLKAFSESLQESIDIILAAKESLERGYGREFYEYQLHVAELATQGFAPTATLPNQWVWDQPASQAGFTEQVSLAQKQWLLDKDIKPIVTGELIPNRHVLWMGGRTRDGWGGVNVRQEQWEEQNRTLDNSGLFLLYLAFTNYVYYIPLILLLFFVGGGLAKERGKKLTYRMLKTQPISQTSLMFGKIVNGLTIGIGASTLIPLLVLLTGSALNRFGDWKFPILHLNAFRLTLLPDYSGSTAGFGQGYHFITLGRYLINSSILLICVSIFIICLSITLSLFIKRTISVISATSIIIIGGYWLNFRKYLQVSPRSPFTYFNIPKVVNGELGARLNNPSFNVYSGVVVLLGLSIIILCIGYVFSNEVVRKRLFNKLKGNKSKEVCTIP